MARRHGVSVRRAFPLLLKVSLIQIDAVYCDVIVSRWEQFSGRKAQRVPPQKRTRASDTQGRVSRGRRGCLEQEDETIAEVPPENPRQQAKVKAAFLLNPDELLGR